MVEIVQETPKSMLSSTGTEKMVQNSDWNLSNGVRNVSQWSRPKDHYEEIKHKEELSSPHVQLSSSVHGCTNFELNIVAELPENQPNAVSSNRRCIYRS